MKRNRVLWLLGIVLVVACAVIVLRVVFMQERDFADEFSQLLQETGVEKPNVILITLDTTRADHLPCYGYSNVRTPHLDGLARRAILFENCTATSPLTLPSHCSMMTGLCPTYHGVRVNGNTALSDQHLTLAELLSQQGYQCGAFIGAFVLDGRWGLNQGFSHYDDKFDLKKYKQLDLGLVQRPGNEVVDSALEWMEGRTKDRFFAWIHLYDPHTPYEPPEPYFSEYNTGLVGLYDGEIAFMDEQIGRVAAWLEGAGLAKNTLIAIIGDHGEGLGSHGELTHGYFIYDYAIQVPFLIVTPLGRFQGMRIRSQVSTVDLYPTLLGMAGVGIPEENQGASLLPVIFNPNRNESSCAYSESYAPNIQYGWSPLLSLRDTKYKYIDAPRAELYDLSADPDESANMNDRFPKVAKKMKNALDEIVRKTSLSAPSPQAANLDRDTVERLAALGYIGAPVSQRSSQQNGGGLVDPKDKLHIYESVQKAGELITREGYEEAVRILESVLREEPSIPQALLLVATCYSELGRKEEAKVQYDVMLKDDPNSIQALIGMANLLMEEGRKEDVIALCKQALSVDERNTQAYALIGEIYMSQNDHGLALPYLEKAVEIQPKLTQNSLNLAACYIGLKRYGEAEPVLKNVLADYPKFPLAYFHLGLLYEETGRLKDSLEAYQQEVSLYPDHYRARFNLGKLLFASGDLKGYKEEMEEVIRIAPKAPEGYLFLARGLLREPGDLDSILRLVEEGIALARTSDLKALGYFLLADVYTRKNQPEKVREALARANAFKNSKDSP